MRNLGHWAVAAVALATVIVSPRAEAVPLLRLQIDDPSIAGIEVDITDLGATGTLVNIGAVGNWVVNVTTGLGAPILGTPDAPTIDLNSIDVATGGGTLILRLTQTGNSSTFPSQQFSAAIGGTATSGTGNSLSYAAYVDSTDTAFGTETLIGSGLFNGGAFAYTGVAIANTGALYSMTEVVTLTAAPGTGISFSFNAELRAVPAPASLALLGVGLAGLGLIRRRTMA